MLQDLDAMAAARKSATRPTLVRAWEKQLGLPDVEPLLTGSPKSTTDYLASALNAGISGIGQTAAGLGSLLPGTLGENFEQRRLMYKDRRRIYSEHARRYKTGEAARVPVLGTPAEMVEAGVQLPLDLVNPSNKATAAASLTNMAWHGLRGYAPEKKVSDAALAAGSHLVGEKVENLLPSGNLAGNVAGVVFEKRGKDVRDALFPPPPPPAATPPAGAPPPFAVVPPPATPATPRRAITPTPFFTLLEQRRRQNPPRTR